MTKISMGKIKVATLGNEEEEKKQKEEARIKREEKKRREASAKEAETPKEAAPAQKQKEKKTKQVKTHVRGKKYNAAKSKVKAEKSYKLSDAIPMVKTLKYASFDETVELHLNLKEGNLKGEAQLPHGTGKSVKAVIATDAVIEEIEKGQINFDILLATPAFMPKLIKFARVLGPKGLMPNPKNGTVSANPEEALKKFAGGAVRFKSEPKFPLLHQAVGKSSFEDKALVENIQALVKAVGKDKITEAYISLTMSPSVRLSLEDVK
jgi:large subunit ribosomal protein L1